MEELIKDFPVVFAFEENDLCVFIEGKRVGFLRSIELTAEADKGVTKLKFERIDYVKGTWDLEWEEILKKHIPVFEINHIDMTDGVPYYELSSHRTFFKEK